MEVKRSKHLFIHIHVPKTAGSSFNKILEKNFGKCFAKLTGKFIAQYPNFKKHQWNKFISRHPGVIAAASHKFNLDIPFGHDNKQIVAIAFLRDPVERFFSFYFHMRHRKGADCIQKKMSAPEYLDFKTNNGEGYLPGQVGWLIGEKKYSLTELKQLVREGKLILGRTERFQETLDHLNNLYPDLFQYTDSVKSNVSTRDQTIEKELKQKAYKLVEPIEKQLLKLTI